jgi:hypothetical protein
MFARVLVHASIRFSFDGNLAPKSCSTGTKLGVHILPFLHGFNDYSDCNIGKRVGEIFGSNHRDVFG